jgi:hypothetical protein
MDSAPDRSRHKLDRHARNIVAAFVGGSGRIVGCLCPEPRWRPVGCRSSQDVPWGARKELS